MTTPQIPQNENAETCGVATAENDHSLANQEGESFEQRRCTMPEIEDTNKQCPLLMELDEAATFIGIPRSTLHTWAWQGRVPCVRLGRRRFFRRADLERWVENHLCLPGRRIA